MGYRGGMTSTIARGVVAGAFGTMLLDAMTYLDMALTGRPASNTPGETIRRLAENARLPVPDDESRLAAYGALSGLATGVAIGVLASVARTAGLRLPARVGAVATGALAMAATDTSMARLGVTDPREWTLADWARDVIPHMAYGSGVRWAMDQMDR